MTEAPEEGGCVFCRLLREKTNGKMRFLVFLCFCSFRVALFLVCEPNWGLLQVMSGKKARADSLIVRAPVSFTPRKTREGSAYNEIFGLSCCLGSVWAEFVSM